MPIIVRVAWPTFACTVLGHKLVMVGVKGFTDRLTVMVCGVATLPALSMACAVIVLGPGDSGTFANVQLPVLTL